MAPDLVYSNKSGCSSRQATHHDAQTFSSHTFPRMSPAENVLVGSFNCGRRKVGAALFISAEGSSCGSRRSPIARKTTMTRNRPSGIKYLSIKTSLCVFLCAFAPLREKDFSSQRRKGAKEESYDSVCTEAATVLGTSVAFTV